MGFDNGAWWLKAWRKIRNQLDKPADPPATTSGALAGQPLDCRLWNIDRWNPIAEIFANLVLELMTGCIAEANNPATLSINEAIIGLRRMKADPAGLERLRARSAVLLEESAIDLINTATDEEFEALKQQYQTEIGEFYRVQFQDPANRALLIRNLQR